MIIKTKNKDIELHTVNKEDITNRYNLVIRNKIFLGRWLEWVDFYKSEEDLINFSEKCINEEREKSKFTYLIYFKNTFVGQVDIQNLINPDKPIEIGYWLGLEYNGNGIMTEAVSTMIDYVFEHYNANEVVIRAETENHSSKNVAKRLGFDFVKTLEGHFIKKGNYYDIDVFSMSREKWLKPINNLEKIL